ncbi:L-lactate permease [Caldalkalibacillus mannanilyticus]|uniref:L-lactate permease n=1 Tax=Caldalkalibacillus mannanilyticus TaxID=1418 RepID=UPI000469EF12|nr:L-lactate permease [Caldalkalibacillus mannanilyticus]
MIPFFFSLIPLCLILFLLFGLRLSAWKAGLVGCVFTSSMALFTPFFEFTLHQLAMPIYQGSLTSLIVAYVIVFGIWLYHLLNEAKVIETMAKFISESTQDPIRQVLILTLAFSPLVESLSGFGIAMIVVAPILIALGVERMKAVLISLVSLCAVPWGTLGMGTVIGAQLGNLSVQTLGVGSALLSLPTFIYFALIILFLAGGWSALKSHFWEAFLAGSSMGVSVLLLNKYVSVELAGVFGSFMVMGVLLLFMNNRMELLKNRNIRRAFKPYLFLIVLLLLSRLIPDLKGFLLSHGVVIVEELQYSLPLLYSPGFFLFLTCLFTIGIYRMKQKSIFLTLQLTRKQASPVIFATLFFIILSEIMSEALMTQIIAEVTATFLGPLFLLVSPVIGGLGGFLTGSNTASNAMFIKLQVQAAQYIGISPELTAYAQNTASSHAIMASPSRVLLGATIAQIPELENELLKRITLIALGTLVVIILGLLFMYVVCP